jgi:hypothetical protein
MTFNLNFPRERDCYVLFKGDAYPVAVSQAMRANGWQGGQGVQWINSPLDEFLVTYSDGLYGGFMLWGSNEDSDKYASLTGNQPLYGFGTLCAGGWIIATRTFERYTWASRQAGPLVELNYVVGERVRFSLRGFWTKEDEWALSVDPRGANGYFIGSVVQAPSADNNHYVILQTSI